MGLNWKLVAALAAPGPGIDVSAAGWRKRPPLADRCACLLSMLLMMRAMGTTGSGKRTDERGDSDEGPEAADRGSRTASRSAGR